MPNIIHEPEPRPGFLRLSPPSDPRSPRATDIAVGVHVNLVGPTDAEMRDFLGALNAAHDRANDELARLGAAYGGLLAASGVEGLLDPPEYVGVDSELSDGEAAAKRAVERAVGPNGLNEVSFVYPSSEPGEAPYVRNVMDPEYRDGLIVGLDAGKGRFRSYSVARILGPVTPLVRL